MSMSRPLIMVIDDSVIILEFMQVVLNSEGYSVIGCQPGANNAAYARQLRPDLVILELQRAGLDLTITFIESLRQDAHTSNLPIIIMSPDTELLRALDPFIQRQGCIAIEKPFTTNWLTEKIHQLVYSSIT